MKMHKMLFSYDRAILQLKLKKVKTLIWELPCMLGWLLLVACNAQPANERQAGTQPDIFPDYIGVTVPVDIAPLNFAMADDSVSSIDVTVKGSLGGSIHVGGDYADFPIDEWHELLNQNRGAHLSVSVAACREGRWTRYRTFLINVGNDSIGARSITYRRIAPGYEQYGHMGIYKRSLASFDETALVDNSSRPGMCVNCHTNNGGNGEQYVFHARNENGGTFIKHNGKLARVVIDKKSAAAPRSFVYPGWHPSGRYCAFSTNKTSQMFHLANAPKRIEVYDSESDVFVYDVEKHRIIRDTLTMRRYWAETCPAFSADGQWLYFVTARRQLYPVDYDKEQYVLCRVAFDERTGRFSSDVDTLINTPDQPSVTWPRPSADGRYLMYTVADWGYFTIWHPEADLWLLDLQSGEQRRMDEVNSPRADSFHNWSPSGNWFLFTSRRGDGLYTRIYFSRLGDDGRATKPFLLPQRNPRDYDVQSLYSFNTPEFEM
jgi:hypothetical protein